MKYKNHYEYLDAHIATFLLRLTKQTLMELWCSGIVGAHGDKCYQYKDGWEKRGISFERGALLYLLTYVPPYSKEVREVIKWNGSHYDKSWVDPYTWVIENYKRFEYDILETEKFVGENNGN